MTLMIVEIDANVDRSTSCMESQCYPYLDLHGKTSDVTRATNTPSHDWTLEYLSMYEPHIRLSLSYKYLIFAYSRQRGYPAQPSIGDIFTCFGLHRPGCMRSASHMHASHRVTYEVSHSPLADVATFTTRNMSPMQIYYDLPRVVV
jgi:hypothetical protein